MYSRYDFAPWILSGGAIQPVLRGPDRPGHRSNANPWDDSDIYLSTRRADGSWSPPVNLGLNGPFGDSSGMEIDGGNTFVWLQGTGISNSLVMAHKNPDGSWSAPIDFGPAINVTTSGVYQDNPHLSPDGKALWFTSNRPGGAGGKDLWFSQFRSGNWSAPVALGSPFTTSGDDDQFWVSPVSLDIYWNTPQGLMHCLSNGSTCAAVPTQVVIPGCPIVAEASLPDDGLSIYFGCGDPATGRIRIMVALKQTDGSWGPATPVD